MRQITLRDGRAAVKVCLDLLSRVGAPADEGAVISVLTDFEFRLLEELASGVVLGRAAVAYLAGDQATADVDPVMARSGRWRLAARGGSRRDPKWEATELLMRRFRVLEALGPINLETSDVAQLVGESTRSPSARCG